MAKLRDDIGTRMKNFYEQIPKTKLMRRCPVAIRIDGKAFHTYTRNFKRPFDSVFMRAMQAGGLRRGYGGSPIYQSP